jgi:glycosyltransferase involved in cell wall biosynthesis
VRLLIHSPFYRPHVGGVETYVEELDQALWAAGAVDGITVLAPDLPAGAPDVEHEPDGTRIVRYPAVEAIPNFPLPCVWRRGWWRALRLAAEPGPDLVVAHTRFFPSTAVALAHARRLRVPYVHVEHGSDYVQMDGFAEKVARLYDATIGRAVLRAADARIAISAAAAEFVRRLAGVDATVVYRGVPLDRLGAARPAPGAGELAGGRRLIVYVGRLIDGKGVADLVTAVDGIAANVCCVVVGDGPRRADLERQVGAARRGDRFAFLGYLPEDEALAWIAAADVVVNPSYTEGLPTTVLWAAALGRPVVATSVGGTPEIVADGVSGLLVPPRAPAVLQAALESLVADPELRERLGAAASEDIRERFDTERGAERWLAAASAALDGASRRQVRH